MEKARVLMIDDNVALVRMVKEYFRSHAKIDVVLEAYDGCLLYTSDAADEL